MPAIPNCIPGLRRENITAISAPYNFVPLPNKVHIPEWSKQVSHDWPFEDGYSGEIHYRLIAESPILVGGKQEKHTGNRPNTEIKPFQLPDGTYAIPGSSIKGMLRSVVEIAGFGRMRMVDDQNLSVRDLTGGARKIYGDHMTETVGPNTYRAKPQAGWLYFDTEKNRWQITPCRYARVEHDDLATVSKDDWWETVPRKPLAKKKYERWGGRRNSLDIKFTPDPEQDHPHSDDKKLRYRKALNLGSGETTGTLVFTGQPAKREHNKPGRKHLEFIFYNEASEPIEVPESVWRAFAHIYAESEDWNTFWKKKDRIPVFFLMDQEQVASLGLSLMYRLPYQLSIHDAIANSSASHRDEPGTNTGYDLADLLFGAINSTDQNAALCGRVSCELARAEGDPEPIDVVDDTILNSPKPSYYPNYIEQQGKSGAIGVLKGQSYNTLMDSDTRIRGFKRYPARPDGKVGVQELTPDQESNKKVQVRLHPLPTGTAFKGRIVFHNLKPEELGALLWAMTWGGDDGLRHGIGMGKPFGFGQVRFEIDAENSCLIPNTPDQDETVLDESHVQDLLKKFTQHMEQAAANKGGWAKSPQIANLQAMADPASANHLRSGLELRHMCLSGRFNEFTAAKQPAKGKREEVFFLADYANASKWGKRQEERQKLLREQQKQREEEARKQQEEQARKNERETYEVLPPHEKARVDLQRFVDILPETLTKDRYPELVGAINAYVEKAKEWDLPQREEASDLVKAIYDRFGWGMPGYASKKKKKQEEKKRNVLKNLVAGD